MEAIPLTTYVLGTAEYSRFVAGGAPTQPFAQILPGISSQGENVQTTEPTFAVVTSTVTVLEVMPTSTLSELPPMPFPTPGNSSTTAVTTPLPSTILGPAGYFTAPRSSRPAPTDSLLETLLVDKSFTQTAAQQPESTHSVSSHTGLNGNDITTATSLPTAGEARSGGTGTTHVIVIVVAIGGIITVLVSVSVIFMYCIRSRSHQRDSFPGGPQPMSFRDMFRRKMGSNRAMAMVNRTSIGSFFARKHAQAGGGEEAGRQVTGVSIYDSSQLPSPTAPIPIPDRPVRPNRPERTPSTLLHGIPKSVSWDVKEKNRSVTAPSEFPVTRSPSIRTPSSRSDRARSPAILDDGAPLPDPPARPKHFPPRPITGIPNSSLPTGNRRSVSTPLNIQLTPFYGLPGGDLSNLTYTTAPESPAAHVASPLSPPPPVRLSSQSRPNAREEDDRTPTRLERLTSLYTGSISYLRGSQAASSHYNSVLGAPNSIYDPPSAYNYYSDIRRTRGLESSSDATVGPLYGGDPTRKSIYSLGYKEVHRNTYGTYSSSMTDLTRTSKPTTRTISANFTDSFAVGLGGGREAALALLGGNSSLTPAARQSSIRGSGLVNCSKPSLVSFTDPRHESEGNAEIAAGDSTEDEHEDRPCFAISRAASHHSFSAPVETTTNRSLELSATYSKADGLDMEASEMRTSGTESLHSCTTTGSSILYANERGFNLELHGDIKEGSSAEHTPELVVPRPLTTLLENNFSDTFGCPDGALRLRESRGLTAGGFKFPSPWTRKLHSPRASFAQPAAIPRTITPSDSRQASGSSMTMGGRNNTSGPSHGQTFPLFVHTPPSSLAGPEIEDPNSGVSDFDHVPTMDALIQQLKKEKKTCTCDCSSSSLYSTSTRSKSVKSGNSDKSNVSRKSRKSRKSSKSEERKEESPPLGHSTNSSHSSDYLPPPAARESVTAYLTATDMSPATLSPEVAALPNADPNNVQHTTHHPFIFPFQTTLQLLPATRHSLPLPQSQNSFSLPQPPSLTNIPLSPSSSPRLSYTPSPFSTRRSGTSDTPSPRPMTRGKHRHYRSNSFSGTITSASEKEILGTTTTAATGPLTSHTPEKTPAGGYRVGSKVRSMMVFPRFSAIFGVGAAKSDTEKHHSVTSLRLSKQADDNTIIHAMV